MDPDGLKLGLDKVTGIFSSSGSYEETKYRNIDAPFG